MRRFIFCGSISGSESSPTVTTFCAASSSPASYLLAASPPPSPSSDVIEKRRRPALCVLWRRDESWRSSPGWSSAPFDPMRVSEKRRDGPRDGASAPTATASCDGRRRGRSCDGRRRKEPESSAASSRRTTPSNVGAFVTERRRNEDASWPTADVRRDCEREAPPSVNRFGIASSSSSSSGSTAVSAALAELSLVWSASTMASGDGAGAEAGCSGATRFLKLIMRK